jgi:hypothetical protein
VVADRSIEVKSIKKDICLVVLMATTLFSCVSAMNKNMLTVSCTPVHETNRLGAPIPIRITVMNISNAEVEIPAIGIPWQTFYAIEFRVKNVRGFKRVFREWLPLELPSIRIPAGGSIEGEVDLSEYLLTPTGESIAQRPGDYAIEATIKTFLPKPRGGHQLIRLRSKPFAVSIVTYS